jgi:hypothetical protein
MARKTLVDMVKNVSTEPDSIKETAEKYSQLAKAVETVTSLDTQYKQTGKIISENKDIIKKLCSELCIDSYETPNGSKISVTEIDKSYLNEAEVLNYLRTNKLDKFIKTKEYYDETEIAMAIANNELKAEDFVPFTIEKKEVRLNFKK